MAKNILRNRGGQGLIETMVAIGIFITGMISSVALIIGSLAAGQQSSDQIVASNLAWEGIEVVKNIRDSNYLAGAAWNTGLTGADTSAIAIWDDAANTWTINFSPSALTDAAAVMYRSAGIYKQSTTTPPGQATNFSRLITLDPNGTVNMLIVRSQVLWTEKGASRTTTAETRLYDWR